MNKLILILLLAFTFNCYSQEIDLDDIFYFNNNFNLDSLKEMYSEAKITTKGNQATIIANEKGEVFETWKYGLHINSLNFVFKNKKVNKVTFSISNDDEAEKAVESLHKELSKNAIKTFDFQTGIKYTFKNAIISASNYDFNKRILVFIIELK